LLYCFGKKISRNKHVVDACSFSGVRQHSVAAVNDNFQPMTTYEPLDVHRQGPVSYDQLPPQIGHNHDYYNVGSPANTSNNTAYEELDINAQRPVIYEQLT